MGTHYLIYNIKHGLYELHYREDYDDGDYSDDLIEYYKEPEDACRSLKILTRIEEKKDKKMVILEEVIKIMEMIFGDIDIIIRRDYGDCKHYFEGKLSEVPKDFEYLNRCVLDIYSANENGDLALYDWKNATLFDIAIGDL